jgi:general secretion pathway protein I
MKPRGFSLLEILVAFSILALSLGVLMQIFGNAARNAGLAHDQARATTLAQSLLANAGVGLPLVEGENKGTFDDRMHWTVTIIPYENSVGDGGSVVPQGLAVLELWQITTQIAWDDGTGTLGRSVTLTTLRTSPRSRQ